MPHERARDRVDVKTGNSVVVDTSATRISIEDAAQFNGRIEIDSTKSHTGGN